MGRFLTLRGGVDGERLADVFAARGLSVAILPLQEIVMLPAAVPDGRHAGLLVTSAHAVPWLAARQDWYERPALAVGSRTAQALAGAGFRDVRAGDGDAKSLLPLARTIASRSGEPILYAAGRVRRPETEALFSAAGVSLRTVEVYDTRLRQPDRGEVEGVSEGQPLDGVLLLSAEQARCFAAFSGRLRFSRLLCLSPRIREALPAELRPIARAVRVPTLAALAEEAAGGQEARGMP